MIAESDAVMAMCRESFDAFAQRAFHVVEPGTKYEWNWHIGCVSEHLQAVYNGEIKRIIFNLPPRCLKSYEVARAFPAWVMGKSPQSKFINTSFGYEVAEQNAMACRRMMKSDWYKAVFPHTVISTDLDRNTHFETTMAGQYYAATALSALTGMGCDYMICDDLLKPSEAVSPTIRNGVNDNMRRTFFSRFNDKRTGRFVLVMQRLHEDDPTGNLLKDGGYVHVKLPAEAKTQIVITLKDIIWKMEPGELLFPERLSREQLDQDMLDMTAYNYAGQMLQEPVPAGGGEFKHEWVQYYANGSLKPKLMNIVILVDPAGGDELNKRKKKLSDWTAMVVVGLASDNNYYLLDIVRDRLNPTDRVNTLFLLHRKWNELSGKPPKVGYEKYGMMTDTHYIEEKKKQDGYHFALIELGGGMMKEERIRRLVPDLQNRRWYFPNSLIYIDGEGRQFDLVKELVDAEMASFPKSRFDDMLDALSRIYEPDLSMVFPAPVKTMMDKALIPPQAADDWSQW